MINNNFQFQGFIRSLVHIASPATTLESTVVQDMMLEHLYQHPEVYYRVDSAGLIKEIGKGIERLTGFAGEELIGAHLDNFLMPGSTSQESESSLTMRSASFYHASGNYISVNLESRRLEYGGCEGLMYRHRVDAFTVASRQQHFPLLTVSVSGGILSCNEAAREILGEWKCTLGGSLPDQMQDQILDTWLAGHPLRFDSYAYIPLSHEGVVLLATMPDCVEPVDQPIYSFQGNACRQLLGVC